MNTASYYSNIPSHFSDFFLTNQRMNHFVKSTLALGLIQVNTCVGRELDNVHETSVAE